MLSPIQALNLKVTRMMIKDKIISPFIQFHQSVGVESLNEVVT